MACRIQNHSPHPLHLDLRGGETLSLQPGELSTPLRDELLADNPYLPGWLRRGLASRHEIPFTEVLAAERLARYQAASGRSAAEIAAGLERIKGLGPALARQLMARGLFTVGQVAALSAPELAELPGVGAASARQILKSAQALSRAGKGKPPEENAGR